MTKEEINDDLINEYLNVKSKKTHLLSLNCVEVKEHIEVIKTSKKSEEYTLYSYCDFVFDEDDDEPMKMLLNSDYFIEIVYTMFGIKAQEYKSKVLDFDDIHSKAIAKFDDIQYISKIVDAGDLCNDYYKISNLCNNYNIEMTPSIKHLTNIIDLEFDFTNSKIDAKRVLYEEGDVYLKCVLYALPIRNKRKGYSINDSTWLEVLIQSISQYQQGDYYTSYQLAFSSLDGFLSNEFNEIYNYLISIDKLNKDSNYVGILDKKITTFSNSNLKIFDKLKNIMNMLGYSEVDYEKEEKQLDLEREYRNILSHSREKDDKNRVSRYDYDFEGNYKNLLYKLFRVFYMIDYVDFDINDAIEEI